MITGNKVLFITYDGLTDPLGQSQVIPYLELLSQSGFEITILSTEKRKRYQEGKGAIEKILAATSIKWQSILFTSRPPILSKIYDVWRLNRKALKLYKKERFDFVHIRSYVPAGAALKLKRKHKVPFLFDMRGFWVDERVDNGQWNLANPFFKYLYKLYKAKEKIYLKEAAFIIVLTEKGKNELVCTFKVAPEKITVIPCSADLDHFDFSKITDEEKKEIKQDLNISNEVRVLSYLGSLGGWYLTDEMLDFFSILKKENKNTVFLFITHNDKKEILQKTALKGIEEDAIRVKPASRQNVPRLLSISDWSIFFIKNAYSKRASSPTKQGEIMAMGIPIICNDIGDTGLIIEKSHAGILVNSFNEKEYETVVKMMENIEQHDKNQIRASAFLYYDLKRAATSYYSVYQKMQDKKIQ